MELFIAFIIDCCVLATKAGVGLLAILLAMAFLSLIIRGFFDALDDVKENDKFHATPPPPPPRD